jgi:hypothetical protein
VKALLMEIEDKPPPAMTMAAQLARMPQEQQSKTP